MRIGLLPVDHATPIRERCEHPPNPHKNHAIAHSSANCRESPLCVFSNLRTPASLNFHLSPVFSGDYAFPHKKGGRGDGVSIYCQISGLQTPVSARMHPRAPSSSATCPPCFARHWPSQPRRGAEIPIPWDSSPATAFTRPASNSIGPSHRSLLRAPHWPSEPVFRAEWSGPRF
jgi:hypothetical protein